ncbi:MAG: hypothetical protein NTV33_05140 [Coprothermobacterota bacterium]|nr:hypothetical protein [Coprothermobacterota bacterium]
MAKKRDDSEEGARLEACLPGFSWQREGWNGLHRRLGLFLEENHALQQRLATLGKEVHSEATLNSAMNYRLFELEQDVGALEKNVSAAQADAGAWHQRVEYLEKLLTALLPFAPREERERIEESLRQAIYFAPLPEKDTPPDSST